MPDRLKPLQPDVQQCTKKGQPYVRDIFSRATARRRRPEPRHGLTLTILLAEMLRAGALDLPARHV